MEIEKDPIQALVQKQLQSWPKGVDKAVDSSNDFLLERWQTHMNNQVQDIIKAYKEEVAL